MRAYSLSIAVAIPCYNEAHTIAGVVRGFRAALPEATIYVFNNNSNDGSADLAARAGAVVIRENRQGKGYVMQAILERVQADALVIVDGDGTYLADDVHRLLAPVLNHEADMVVGNRLQEATDDSMRPLHQLGNRLIVALINLLFRTDFEDVLSGYRVLSRRFQQQVPLLTPGFETETELTIQALERGLVIQEIPVGYKPRPPGSESKLQSFRDGYRILLTAAVLLRDHRPLAVFGSLGMISLAVACVAGILRLLEYAGWYTLPTSLLSGLVILCVLVGLLLLGIGLILNAINTRFREFTCLMRRR